jgi:preprotein translocase subunit SecY
MALDNSLKNIFAVSELRNRVLFTLALLFVYRIGSHIVVPGVDIRALDEFAQQLGKNSMFGMYDMFTGNNLSKVTIFALGIMPYISASIILQLLTVVWPYLERLSKEGELGRRKITQYTRYGTIVLSLVQSLGIAIFLERNTSPSGFHLVMHPGWAFRLMTILTLSTGTSFIMWLGEQITERGIGNGMSLIIFAGIIVGFPRGAMQTLDQVRTGQISPLRIVFLVILMVLVVAAIIFVERGHRRVTVQYAKRVVGRRMYGGSSTHIPLKVNTGGVIPVIFASSILAFPATIAQSLFKGPWVDSLVQQLNIGMPLHNLLYVLGIVFFAYFYTAIIFNPDDVAENMRKYGGFIPGIRPGKRTAEYIDTILTRITLAGAIYLALIAILPQWLTGGFRVAPIPFIGEWLDSALPKFITEGMNVQFFFGGTSLLIVVGVTMDTVQQVESQLIMRHYDGFMKKTRLRGRRG